MARDNVRSTEAEAMRADAEIYMLTGAVMAGLALAIVTGGVILGRLEAWAYERDKRKDPA